MRLTVKLTGLMLTLCLIAVNVAQAGLGDWLKSATEKLGDSKQTSDVVSALSNDQIIEGLKEALSVGTEKAVGLLGKEGGYLDDAQVKIPLPEGLEKVAKGLRTIGQDKLVDQFEETINRAAEQAVPETLSIFGDSIRQMSLDDAKGILEGSDTAATDYFKKKSTGKLSEAILPIVRNATKETGVTSAYKGMVSKVGFLGDYVDMDSMDLDQYVTERALDGLFLKLAEQEQLIRKDPIARTTDILKQVFGR